MDEPHVSYITKLKDKKLLCIIEGFNDGHALPYWEIGLLGHSEPAPTSAPSRMDDI
jgi:hypothetical protein